MKHNGRSATVRVRESAKALTKGLDVLEALAANRRELTLTALARELGFRKATAHRITRVLEDRGYLERNPDTYAYRLGLRVWQLGYQVVNQLRLREVARPLLERLARETEEHVNLALLDGHEAVFIDIIESAKPIRAYTYLGGRVPAYCSATGKAILAFQQEEIVTGVIRAGLKPFTDRTIVQAGRLREELKLVRALGYAVNREEWREDVYGLAAPIWNHESKVVASVSITTPASRFDEDKFCSPVMGTARGISQAMGWIEAEARHDARRRAQAEPPKSRLRARSARRDGNVRSRKEPRTVK